MRVGAIIFSRFSSHRLPGKALIDIRGRELLGRVIDRSKFIKNIDEIIVATSSEIEDDIIAEYVKKENIQIFRGSLNNVAQRALNASIFFQLDSFVRICGDRPYFDPDLVTELVAIQRDLDKDLITTTFPRTYPPGLTVEIIKVDALKRAIESMQSDDKEHVTKYFYNHYEDFSLKNIDAPENYDFGDINLCLDTEDDLKKIEWIASDLNEKENDYARMSHLIKSAKRWRGS